MVYCGKPSKGCGACRARKIKCDQTTPACKRCLKTNRICPGYRDQLSLLFRDESETVAQKAKSSAASDSHNTFLSPNTPELSFSVSPSPSPSHSQLDQSSEFDFVSLDSQSSSYSTGYLDDDDEYGLDDDYYASLSLVPMSVDRRQQAICFCFNNFTWLGKGVTGLNLDADILSTSSVAEKAMMKGVVSLGMANLSRMGAPSQSLKMLAQREYSNTLKLTNAAISSPEHATDDATLTAILCMSLFEIVTCRKPERIDAFIQHTKGAVALLQLRGESQLLRAQALDMFQFLRNEIIVSCLMRYYPVPQELLSLSAKALTIPNVPPVLKISHHMCTIMARINDIRIEDLHLHRPSIDASILSRAFAIDTEIQAIVDQLPPEYSPQIFTSAPDQFFGNAENIAPFEGIYHIYPSFIGAMVANHFRYARLLTIEVIFNRYKRMVAQRDFVASQEFKDHCYALRDIVRDQARDICATVPFSCGFIDGPNSNVIGQKLVTTVGGVGLLFPLYVAGSAEGYGSACSHWVARCFNLIGREMGIDQALALADILPVERGMMHFIDDYF